MKRFNQTCKKLYIFIFVILLVGIISAQSNGYEYYDFPPENIFSTSIKGFAQQSGSDIRPFLRQPDGAKVLQYYDEDGNFVSREVIPQGYNFDFKDDNLILSGKSSEPFKIFGMDVFSKGFTEIKVSGQEEAKTLEITRGVADITVGGRSFEGIRPTKKYNSQEGPGQIENAVIKTDKDGNIIFAKFNSERGGLIDFEYKGKIYRFFANENSNILFDPENGIIKGDGADLSLPIGDKIYKFNGEYSLSFDKNGNLIKVETNGKFESNLQGFSTSRKSLTVVFDRDEFNKLNENNVENIVLIDDKEILMKGFVDVESLDDTTLYYHGDKDSFTAFDRENKKFFVKEGDAIFGNGKYEIEIKNGESFFTKKEYFGTDGNPTLFSFEHENSEDVLEIGTIGFEGMKLEIVKDGKVFFDENIESKLKRGTSTKQVVLEKLNKEILNLKSQKFDQELKTLESGSTEWYDTYLKKLKNDEQLNFANGDKIVSREIFNNLKDKIGDLESKQDPKFKNLLAEYYEHAGDILTQQLRDGNSRYEVKKRSGG